MDFKLQLNEYLETYTSGGAKVIVEACSDARVLDAWRQLADKGNSMRQHHLHVLRRKAYFPKSVASDKNVVDMLTKALGPTQFPPHAAKVVKTFLGVGP